MLKQFKEFALKGNVLDLAVGVIIGSAFGKIVSSLVTDIIMPPIGIILGKVNFSNLYINLSDKDFNSLAEAKSAGAATINYGLFINNVVDFFFVAMAIFIMITAIQRVKARPSPEAVTKDCSYCFSSISIKATRCPCCTSSLA